MDSSSLINHKLLMMNWNVVHVMILAYITTSSIESSVIGGSQHKLNIYLQFSELQPLMFSMN